jgi:hypothetical protein
MEHSMLALARVRNHPGCEAFRRILVFQQISRGEEMQFMRTTITAAVAAALSVIPVAAQAATEAQKRAAIDSGLAYLASQQMADGRWVYSGGVEDAASTGSALLAFLEEKPNWGANAVAYQAVVTKGLNYLFSQATAVNIGLQTYGNPDTNGNGIGVKFVPGGVNGRDTYVTGLVLPAIAKAAAETPATLVTVGAQAGRTYAQVVQDTIDYFAYGQNDSRLRPRRLALLRQFR